MYPEEPAPHPQSLPSKETGPLLIALVIALSALWLLWSGIYDNPLLLGLGAFSVAFVVWMTRRMHPVAEATAGYTLGPRPILYLPWLAWEIVKANFQVARIILDPKLPISPRLIRVPAPQQTDLGRVLYANSITLTPGTVSLDLRGDELLIHALTHEAAEGVRSGEMERRVTRMERPA